MTIGAICQYTERLVLDVTPKEAVKRISGGLKSPVLTEHFPEDHLETRILRVRVH